jgi:hypothetical protein
MNIERLKEAEAEFFFIYPYGFESPEMKEIGKKHKMGKMIDLVHETLNPESLEDVDVAIENIIKVASRSSMVSVFEKTKFRDGLRQLPTDEKEELVDALKELLHGDEEKGFNGLVDLLSIYKLAKWPLITVFRCYYYPDTDLLFKPTTVKNVIKKYELEELVYRPAPSYEFFVGYRDTINSMKQLVSPLLSPNNAAFSGFLMMTME